MLRAVELIYLELLLKSGGPIFSVGTEMTPATAAYDAVRSTSCCSNMAEWQSPKNTLATILMQSID